MFCEIKVMFTVVLNNNYYYKGILKKMGVYLVINYNPLFYPETFPYITLVI